MNHFKKVLLITDFAVSENVGGISQTLFNILNSYPEGAFAHLINREAIRSDPPSGIFHRKSITYKGIFIPQLRNRLGGIINKHIYKINLFLVLICLKFKATSVIKGFKPDVIMVCPNGILGVEIALFILKHFGLPSITYFMDDWMNLSADDKVNKKVARLLNAARKRIFISEALRDVLYQRYNMSSGANLVLHNPVMKFLQGLKPEDIKYVRGEDGFTIIYAGSIWPMHYDSLLSFARAVDSINNEGSNPKINLLIYTKNAFWSNYKRNLAILNGVYYKGFVAYQDTQAVFKRADALLVTSSFADKWRSHSYTSVQTKLTDYMAALKPIISIGPYKAACNEFVARYNCGFVICSNDIELIKKDILKITELDFTPCIRSTYKTIEESFDAVVVQQKCYDFINK